MFESNWPLEDVKIVTFVVLTNHLPTFASQRVHLIFSSHTILPFLHKVMSWQAVYDFSKVEKKIVANQQDSCKGSQCNRVDPITNPLNSGVTL